MRTRTVGGIVALVAACACAGCGGSYSPSSRSESQRAEPTPAQSNPDIGLAAVQGMAPQAAVAGSARSHHSLPVAAEGLPTALRGAQVQRARPTPATTKDDTNESRSALPNPCRLVSLSAARALVGGAITVQTEAPLGPTCIYQAPKASTMVTLAVETTSLARQTRQLRARRAIVVAGRHGYCGRLGGPLLLVPFGKTETLTVSAPCDVAVRFAALALRQHAT